MQRKTSQLFQYIVGNERKDILDQYEEAPPLYSKYFSDHIYKPGRKVP